MFSRREVMEKRAPKYLHVLWQDDLKFFSNLIAMINDPLCGFDKDEHLFITPFVDVFEELKDRGNVEFFDEGSGNWALVHCISSNANRVDWVFFHGAVRKASVLLLRKSILKKIVWRTWGGELFFSRESKNILRSLLSAPLNSVLAERYKGFRAFGVANLVDVLEVERRLPGMQCFHMSYSTPDFDSLALASESLHPNSDEEDRPVEILVGHSGYEGDHHKTILRKLSRFKNENIRVNLVLSYGDSNYIEEVAELGDRLFGKKCRIIKDFMPKADYGRFLKSMDVAILDDMRSSALGNFSALVAMEKSLYINALGVYREAMEVEGLPYRLTDDIDNMSFSDFASPLVYETRGMLSRLAPKPMCCGVKRWHSMLRELDEEAEASL